MRSPKEYKIYHSEGILNYAEVFPDFDLKFGTTRTVGFQEFWKFETYATKVGWVYLLGISIAKIE